MAQKTTTPQSALKSDRDKLVADLKILMEDAKTMTGTAADDSKEFLVEKAEDLRAQLDATLVALKEHGDKFKETAVEKSKDLEKCIQKNPWKAVGIAVLAGIVIDRLASK